MHNPPHINTLSELLAATIADSLRLDRDRYHPRYLNWHEPNTDGLCRICLAGSFLAGTLNSSPKKQLAPWNCSSRTQQLLECINCMRVGSWVEAFQYFYQRKPAGEVHSFLFSMRVPVKHDFIGWLEFDMHLHSLESFVVKLREIEAGDSHIAALKG